MVNFEDLYHRQLLRTQHLETDLLSLTKQNQLLKKEIRELKQIISLNQIPKSKENLQQECSDLKFINSRLADKLDLMQQDLKNKYRSLQISKVASRASTPQPPM